MSGATLDDMRVSEIRYRGMTSCVWLESAPGDDASNPLPVQRLVVHPFTTCDGCGMDPIVGVRYHSFRDLNVDLCEVCANSGVWAREDFARFDGTLEVKTEKVKVRCAFTTPDFSNPRVNTLPLMVPKRETIADLRLKIGEYLTQYSAESGVEALYLAKCDGEWISPTSQFALQDCAVPSNRLDETRTAGSYFKDDEESFIFAVCLPMRDNTQYSTWIPPSFVHEGDNPSGTIRIAISQRRDTFCWRDDERLAIKTTPTVRGCFVKFERRGSELEVRRIHGELASTKAAAISYAWGTLPHSKLLRVRLVDLIGETDRVDLKPHTNCDLKLGEEWSVNLLESKLVELSERYWLWIDQLCLPQEEGLSMVLATEIATIYSSCKVFCLVATVECAGFRELQRASVSLKDSLAFAKAVETHTANCSCLQNWQVYFSRIWPWQEFTLGSDIEVHLALGCQSKFEAGSSTPLGMAHNQIAVKLADRFWTVSDNERISDFLRATTMLILGWGVRCDRRRKIAKFDTLYFLTWFSRTHKTATKMVDFIFAVTPMLELAPDITITSKMSVLEGIFEIMKAFEDSQHDCYLTGSIPIGMKIPTMMLPHRYRNALLNFWHQFSITNTIDLLPFICSSGMMRKVNGFLVGYANPCTVERLVAFGGRPYPVNALQHHMSKLQIMQVLEFRGALSATSALDGRARAVLNALIGGSEETPSLIVEPETAHNFVLLNIIAVALGMLPVCAYGRFHEMTNDADLVVVRVRANNETKQALAIANQGTSPTHICVSGASLFIGTVVDGTFSVCGRILGSTFDNSLVGSVVQDFMAYAHGENVVKMVPCLFDMPFTVRKKLIKQRLQPVIRTYFG